MRAGLDRFAADVGSLSSSALGVLTGPRAGDVPVVAGWSSGLVSATVLGVGGPDAGGSDDAVVVGGELSGSDVADGDEEVADGLDDAVPDDGLDEGEVVGDDEVGEPDPDGEVDGSVGVGSAVVESPTTT